MGRFKRKQSTESSAEQRAVEVSALWACRTSPVCLLRGRGGAGGDLHTAPNSAPQAGDVGALPCQLTLLNASGQAQHGAQLTSRV